MMHNTVAHHPLTDPQPVAPTQLPPVSVLSLMFSAMELPLWPVEVSSPGSAPCQPLVQLLTGRAQETGKSLLLRSTYPKPSLCYQRYSHTKAKPEHGTSS